MQSTTRDECIPTFIAGPLGHSQSVLGLLSTHISEYEHMEGSGPRGEAGVEHLGNDLLGLVDLAQLGGVQQQPNVGGLI